MEKSSLDVVKPRARGARPNAEIKRPEATTPTDHGPRPRKVLAITRAGGENRAEGQIASTSICTEKIAAKVGVGGREEATISTINILTTGGVETGIMASEVKTVIEMNP